MVKEYRSQGIWYKVVPCYKLKIWFLANKHFYRTLYLQYCFWFRMRLNFPCSQEFPHPKFLCTSHCSLSKVFWCQAWTARIQISWCCDMQTIKDGLNWMILRFLLLKLQIWGIFISTPCYLKPDEILILSDKSWRSGFKEVHRCKAQGRK